jgi:signal transduction histidine kinase
VVGILFAGFGGLLVVNIQRESQSRIARYEETAHLLATSITTSIQNGMLESRPDIIIRTLTDIRNNLKEVRRVDVFRRNGVPAFTDLETVESVNKFTGLEAELIRKIAKLRFPSSQNIRDAAFQQAVAQENPVQSYEESDHGRVLTLYQPLKNQKECQECHNRDHQIRGVVRISLGLEQLDQDLREARNWQLAIAFLTILGVTGTIIGYMGRVVLKPIGEVAIVAKRIGAGELDAQVNFSTRDEIGELSSAINRMAENLKLAYGELELEIAERKHAEAEVKTNLEQIRAQAVALEKANRVKSEFLSVISHELRTPLNVILGYLWLLRDKSDKADNPEEVQLVDKVQHQSKLLLTMVNSILETTRIEANSAAVELTDCSLDRVFDNLKSNCEALINKNISVHWDYTEPLPVIRSDAGKVEKILQNIIENAIKFTDEGSVHVCARSVPESSLVEVQVKDTGVGIAQDALGSIFEVFRQADASTTRSYSGVGLGLYVAKKYADLLGATIEVQSKIGRGSVFTVRLPYNLDLDLANRNIALQNNPPVPESPYSVGNKEL